MEPITQPSRSMTRRLALPASGLIALCAFVHACGGGGGGGGGGNPPAPAPPPPSSFISTGMFPGDGATNISRQPLILLNFNDTVNPATMNATTVTLSQGPVAVATTLTYIACSNRIQMVPNAALDPGLPYTVAVTAGLLDDDGEAMTAISRSFTTTAQADIIRPTFTAAGFTAVPNNPNETTEVFLNWADATDDTSIAGAISYRVYVSTQPVCYNFDAPALVVPAGVTDAIIPGLTPRTLYSFVVRAVDAAGNESLNVNQVNATTFTSFLQNVYQVSFNSCPACHVGPNGQAVLQGINMDYSTPATTYASWVSQASQCVTAAASGFGVRVDPGSPTTSFLWNKISGLPAGVACGGQMPLNAAPLSAEEQDIFFDWITEGALDN